MLRMSSSNFHEMIILADNDNDNDSASVLSRLITIDPPTHRRADKLDREPCRLGLIGNPRRRNRMKRFNERYLYDLTK